MLDIYFNPEYGKLCELVDGGKWAEYSLSTSSGKITNSFIMRPAPWLLDGKQYYDIVTPYGYGGPIIHEASDKPRLLMEYQRRFKEYCIENAIVCEFIRFHPIFKNYEDFDGIYDVVYSRHTVGTVDQPRSMSHVSCARGSSTHRHSSVPKPSAPPPPPAPRS